MPPKMDEWFEGFRAAAEQMRSHNVHLHKRARRYRGSRAVACLRQRPLRPQPLPAILSGTVPPPVLAPAGSLTLLGFLKTCPFEVTIGQGDNAVARLNYERGSRIGGETVAGASDQGGLTCQVGLSDTVVIDEADRA